MDDVYFGIIDLQCTVAGFMGGMVHAFRVEKTRPWEVVRFILVGGIAANFIAPQMLHVMTFAPPGLIALGIGMSGKEICYRIEQVFNTLNPFGKSKNE